VAGYAIAGVDWHDDDGRREYVTLLGPSLERHSGRFIAGTDQPDIREGDWRPSMVVIIEFDTLAQATRWYESEEYREAHSIRKASAKSDCVLLEGVRTASDH
jgi:uncharacterized protein (DUF1330 family)